MTPIVIEKKHFVGDQRLKLNILIFFQIHGIWRPIQRV